MVEIDIVGEGGEGAADFGSGTDFERGTEVELADADAVALQAADGVAGLLVFHGEMAGVVIDAEVVEDALVAGPLGDDAVEEGDGFLRGLERPSGSGSRPRWKVRPVRSERRAM